MTQQPSNNKTALEALAVYVGIRAYQTYQDFRAYQVDVGPHATWAGFQGWQAVQRAAVLRKPRRSMRVTWLALVTGLVLLTVSVLAGSSAPVIGAGWLTLAAFISLAVAVVASRHRKPPAQERAALWAEHLATYGPAPAQGPPPGA